MKNQKDPTQHLDFIRDALSKENEGSEITLSGMLGDASQCLIDHNKPELAKAVRFSRALLGEAPTGEAWCRDILNVLNEVEQVIDAAERSEDTGDPVDLTNLKATLAEVVGWGVNPEDRLRNGLAAIINSLSSAQVALHSGNTEKAEETICQLLASLVIDEG